MPYDQENKAAAKVYVAAIRATIACERCGAQPIEWHNPAHEEDPNRRVAGLTARGYPIQRIQAEIDASTALCRSCHMAIDGRAAALTAARPRKKGDVITFPKPCAACGAFYKPLRKGRCRRCYDAERRRKT